MYSYPHYKEQNPDLVRNFMSAHPFITLIGVSGEGLPVVTQVPVIIREREGKLFICGHIARKSDHHRAFEANPQALALFHGPHCYVSATWYTTNPHMGSTWNYITLHARGVMHFLDEAGVAQILRELSLHYEGGNTASSTFYNNLSNEYTEKMLKAILGFEMEVTDLDNVYKLSQNRDEVSYRNIIAELKKGQGDDLLIAEEMEQRIPELFNNKGS